jgi:type IV pilus assembly protein PilB
MSVLSATAQKQVEETLVKDGVITDEQLKTLQEKSNTSHTPLFSLLVTDGKVTNEALTKAIAHVTKVPYVNLSNAHVDFTVLNLLPQDIAERYMAVPLGEMQHRLVVAMLDADNVQAVDFLSNKVGRPLKVYSASEEGIRNVLKQYQANISDQVVGEISALTGQIDLNGSKSAKKDTGDEEASESIRTLVQDSPISKALSTILEYAAKNNASDVHIEPMPDGLKIRCRIDGVLREIMKLPKSTEPPLVSRIKILANMKIDEHRVNLVLTPLVKALTSVLQYHPLFGVSKWLSGCLINLVPVFDSKTWGTPGGHSEALKMA